MTSDQRNGAGFRALPFEKQKAHFFDVARRALAAWGLPENAQLTLLNITENATFLVGPPRGTPSVDRDPDRENVVFRVHRLDYAEKRSIETELAWILDLKAHTDLTVVTPLKALDGTYVQTIETPALEERRNVVCFAYSPGKAPQDSQDDNEDIGKITAMVAKVPKKITVPLFRWAASVYDQMGAKTRHTPEKTSLTPEDVTIYRRLGQIAATIHLRSEQWTPPPYYQRIEWDEEATFGGGWNNYYGAHYWDLKGYLKKAEVQEIDRCAELIQRRLQAYGKGPGRYGMIHSDLRMSNLLVEGDQFTVLDFDDCGQGWFVYDLACTLGFMEHRPDLQTLIDVVVEGYQSVRPLTRDDVREVWTFILMRRIGLLQAITYHLNNTSGGSGESAELCPEILAFYAKGTAILAKRYQKIYTELPLAAPGVEMAPRALAGALG